MPFYLNATCGYAARDNFTNHGVVIVTLSHCHIVTLSHCHKSWSGHCHIAALDELLVWGEIVDICSTVSTSDTVCGYSNPLMRGKTNV